MNEWTKDVMRHRSLPELKKFAKMIRSHQELILNYFRAKKQFSSGIVEGFNNKAKLTIRKSYGFRSDKLREIALYHTLGNLPVPEITHRFV
jgi:transposase